MKIKPNDMTCYGMVILDGVVFHCMGKNSHRGSHATSLKNGQLINWAKPTVKYLTTAAAT